MNKLFHFWIKEEKKYGEPFALCEKHEKEFEVPPHVIMHEIKGATAACNKCSGPKGAKEAP